MTPRRLVAAALLSFLVFLLLAFAITYSASFDGADFQAALWINGLNIGTALNSVLVAASLYGREYFWVAVVGIMFVLGDRRTRLLAVGLAALFLVGIVAGDLAKALVMRERIYTHIARTLAGTPFGYVLRVSADTDFSFPSGHALIVSIGAFYTLATCRRRWVAGFLTVEAAVVCFSRVYVGAHYPTDVVGGVALGAAIALGGLALERKYLRTWSARLGAYIEKLFGNGPLRL
jgi:membrane-associated phospholipid phosphatase